MNPNTNTSDEYCLKQIDKPGLPAEPLYFCGVPEECDLSSSNILTGHFFADCNFPGTEPFQISSHATQHWVAMYVAHDGRIIDCIMV